MISFITGKPGDGKSLFGTRMILERLVETERFIVTNIPLVREEVLRYVSEEREKRRRRERLEDWEVEPFDIDKRLLIIDDDQVKEFYRFRSGGLVLDPSPDFDCDEERKRLPLDKFRAVMKANIAKIRDNEAYQLPVEYFIDEAHDHFDSRAWASSGRGVMFYASKHRHLHDNIWFLTQVMGNVETRLRNLTSETHVLRNQLRRRIGPIKMRPVFRLYSFYGADTSQLSKSYNPGGTTFRLDPSRVAACYKTCGALGVKVKPEEIKNKGLPWWTLPLGGVAIVLLICFAFVGLPYLGAAATKKAIGSVGATVAQSAGVPLPVSSPNVPDAVKAASDRAVRDAQAVVAEPKPKPEPKPDDKPKPEPRKVVGCVIANKRVIVTLSDGSVFTEADAELTEVNSRFVIISGEKLYYAKATQRLTETPKVSPGAIEPRSPEVQPVPSEEGSWVRGTDGVLRLKERDSLPSIMR